MKIAPLAKILVDDLPDQPRFRINHGGRIYQRSVEVHEAQVSAGKIRAAKVGVVENTPAEIRASQVRAIEFRSRKAGETEVTVDEHGVGRPGVDDLPDELRFCIDYCVRIHLRLREV